jgi:hypothetical protein
MTRFLVEGYVARRDHTNLAEAARRAREATRALSAEGVIVRYLHSILVPGDETCFHLFESQSIDAVEEVGRRAQLPFDRISEAVEPVAKGSVL